MYWTICFLATYGRLSESVRDVLLSTAHTMGRRGIQKRTVRTHEFKAHISTNLDYATLGSFAGMVFTAVVETATEEVRARYIVDIDSDLPSDGQGFWQAWSPRRAAQAHLN